MKTYQFRFESRPCEFRDGFVSVSYMMFSNEDQGMLREDVELTWPQAQTYFKEFVERTVGPRACYMTCHSPRMPPGYKTYQRTIYKKGPST